MITLVLGGTRSGKSELAESLVAADHPPITYVATGHAADEDMAARIKLHQDRRPATWETVQAGADLVAVLARVRGTALVDSLGTWVARCDGLDPDADGLCRVLRERRNRGERTVLVSEEVGLGVHAPTEVGRRFADALGLLNQVVAAEADEVLLVVAGRVLRLDRG